MSHGDVTSITLQILLIHHGFHENRHAFENNYNLRNKNGTYNQLAELLSDNSMISIIFIKFRGLEKSSISGKTHFEHTSLLRKLCSVKSQINNSRNSDARYRCDRFGVPKVVLID